LYLDVNQGKGKIGNKKNQLIFTNEGTLVVSKHVNIENNSASVDWRFNAASSLDLFQSTPVSFNFHVGNIYKYNPNMCNNLVPNISTKAKTQLYVKTMENHC
jgi:hypothetical protein